MLDHRWKCDSKRSNDLRIFCGILLTYAIIGVFGAVFTYFTGRSACIFLNITGVPCPSCGMARSLISLAHGDIGGAFYYHPMFAAPIILPLLFLPGALLKGSFLHGSFIHGNIQGFIHGIKGKHIYKCRNIGLVIIIVSMLTVWAVRLLYLFPNREPFVFYDDSLAAHIFAAFQAVLRSVA